MSVMPNWSRLNSISLLVVSFCALLVVLNILELRCIKQEQISCPTDSSTVSTNLKSSRRPTYVTFGKNVDSGHLKHVFELFDLLGYDRGSYLDDDWDVMWAHDYPFQQLNRTLKQLKPHQKVNHFPGCGFITNKLDLAMSGISFIPQAFRIPKQKEDLLNYAKQNPSIKFVQKSNDHRGIKIKGIDNIDFSQKDSFVQEYIDNPLLVDGHKFDIGVYTLITSFDPLRVYIYNGDVLFRYCPEKYYPFDDEVLNKYVVGDDYLPTWEVPSLKNFYNEMGYSMKESFNGYLKATGRDPSTIWQKVEEAIWKICLNKEPQILKILSQYKSKRNFFEMVRFDFVIDNELNVYVMEVNMSPNLSSAHFTQNQILYEQVLYNVFQLLNFGNHRFSKHARIQVSNKNIVVTPEVCSKCDQCMTAECELCLQCLNSETINILKLSFLEHTNRHDCKRIFPMVMDESALLNTELSPENRLLSRWYSYKCKEDNSWC